MSKICSKCGFENNDSNNYCSKCGINLNVKNDDINNIDKNNIYQNNKNEIDGIYTKTNNFGNSLFAWFAIILGILSILAVIYLWEDLGAMSLFIPVVFVGILLIYYARFKVDLNLSYHFTNNINERNRIANNENETNISENKSNNSVNDGMSKKEIISNKCSTSSYLLLMDAGISFYSIKYTHSAYSIYVAIICYVIGLILMIISVVNDSKNKLSKSLMIVYVILTTIIIIFMSFIISCINDCKNFPT